MALRDKIQARLIGNAEEKERREEIVAIILRTSTEGGFEAVTSAMKNRLDVMEQELKEKLAALKKKF